MAINYTSAAALAKRLIDANGRSITLLRFDSTPSDSAAPWNGPTDPRATPDESATVFGVFVPVSSSVDLGINDISDDLLKRTTEVCLVGPGTVAPPFDLAEAQEMVDGSERLGVTFVRTLKPGGTTILYAVGVRR